MKITMSEIRAAVPHFFSRSTMRFFRSKIETRVIGDGYFVTSEQFDAFTPRFYTIRRFNGMKIDTIGDFQGYPTLAAAYRALKEITNA